MRVVFEFHGEVQVDRQFQRWIGYAVNAEPAWEEIYLYLLSIEEKQFDTEGAQSGSAWVELAENTVARKARLGLRPEILRATDELKNSLTEIDDPNQIKEIAPSMMRYGSFLDRAVYHQSGTEHMPQRRPIDLTDEQKVAIMKGVQLWLVRGVRPTEVFA